MVHTHLTQKAKAICKEAHRGHVDKGGTPYENHPLYLASTMDTEDSVCLALLHDVVEDSPLTLSDIEKEGFSQEIVKALELISREKGIPYFNYILRLSPNELAVKVKLADLMHNSDLTRLKKITPRDLFRARKYGYSRQILESNVYDTESGNYKSLVHFSRRHEYDLTIWHRGDGQVIRYELKRTFNRDSK